MISIECDGATSNIGRKYFAEGYLNLLVLENMWAILAGDLLA
jgi:hypothetical protein